ncbi:MAG: type III pantothenate kinase [Steroidobacteraceae bacterium]
MTVLLVDIGNTRIKWAGCDGGRLLKSHAAVHSAWRAADYARRLFAGARGLDEVLVASVAATQVNRALAAAARRAGVRCRFVTVPRRAGGVTVGYREPWRLGVDRFAALVGAHELFKPVPVCVVGVGTAMTIDLAGGDGRHQGGVIIPAPGLMIDALLANTHGIRRRARGGALGGRGLFGRSTQDAIVQGSRYTAAALIDRAVEEAAVLLGRRPLVVLTGGEAPAVRGLVRSHCVTVPGLVLRGLAVMARAEIPARIRPCATPSSRSRSRTSCTSPGLTGWTRPRCRR